MTLAESATHEVDLVIFEAGGRRWAADAWDVARVARLRERFPTASLGANPGAARALVVTDGEELAQVPIDKLVGFERVAPTALRRLPAYARPISSPAVAGAWLASEAIILLIDLVALAKQGAAAVPTGT